MSAVWRGIGGGRQLSVLASLCGLAISTTTLLGHILHITTLTNIGAEAPGMVPTSAVCVLVAAIALYLLSNPLPAKSPARAVGRALAGGVALAGLVLSAEYVFRWNSGLSELFAATAGFPVSQKPSHYTAIALLFLGPALMALNSGSSRRTIISDSGAVLAFLIGALALAGYVIAYGPFYRTEPQGGMAVLTALSLMALSAGVVAACPTGGLGALLAAPGPGGELARRLLPAPIVLTAVFAGLGLAGGRAGLYSRAMGIWLLNACMIAAFTLVIWWTAAVIHRAHQKQAATYTALQESEQRFKRTFDNSPLGMAMFGLDGRLMEINPALAQMVGWQPMELAGRDMGELCHPDDLARQAEQLRALFSGQLSEFGLEQRCRRKSGDFFWVNLTAAAVHDSQGAPLYGLALIEDISGRKRSQAELKQQAEALAGANRELEGFSYSVSHDLRSPLRAIDGFSRILLDEHKDQLPEQAQRYLQRVREGAVRMGALIDDLLRLAQVGRQPLRKQALWPSSLVKAVISDLEAERQGRQVEFVTGELPQCAADAALLKQVFANLIGNAVKFTRTRTPARIEIGSCGNGRGAIYYVRDNGVGFDPRYEDKLFGLFQRLHRAEDYEGTGVGLAIVQRIVNRHGGRVWAESVRGQGATFYVSMPEG